MIAAIDIGTNTVLLLIAEIENDKLVPVLEQQRIPRLGRGVDSIGRLANESITRVLNVLHEYKQILTGYDVDDVILTATSAVRDAANRDEFLTRVKDETGWNIRILSGDEEAEATFAGAFSVVDTAPGRPAVILDIGGGSTELAVGRDGVSTKTFSLDMGCVRFTERFLKGDPPGRADIRACRKSIEEMFAGIPESFTQLPGDSGQDLMAIGVAGTVTSLAYIELGLDSYDPDKINGFLIDREIINRWITKCSASTVLELIRTWPLVMQGRADIFLAGLLILEGFFNRFDIEKIKVSTGGIRHGILQLSIRLNQQ